MTDPFDALRITDAPLDPRPEFAAELRRTLATALENTMTDTAAPTSTDTDTPASAPAQPQTVTAYISVRNAPAALAFYVEAFGAVELSRLVSDDGRIGHAEITIGNSKLMLADEYPEIDSVGPETRGGPTCSFTIEVPDVDASFARAIAAGAIVERPVDDQFHGNRMGSVRDPFGHRWTLSTPIAGFDHAEYARVAKQEGYELIESRNREQPAEAARRGRPLLLHPAGARPRQGSGVLRRGARLAVPRSTGRRARSAHRRTSLHPREASARSSRADRPGPELWFVVDDIHAAVAKVRELGGSADDPVLYDSGWSADCVDDQGTTFSLSVPAAKYTL